MKPADFTITKTSDANARVFVSKAEVKADNKKVVVVTLFDALTSNTEYNVNTKEVVASDDSVITTDDDKFTYTKADVDAVAFTTTTVAPGTDLKKVVKVTDKLGRDISSEVELEFASSDTSVVGPNGVVANIANGKSAVVKVTVKGTTVSTVSTVINVQLGSAKTLVGYTVAKSDLPANTDAFKELDATKVSHEVYLNDTAGNAKTLGLYFLDQYGNSMSLVDDEATYTNLTPNVAIVDASGKIQPLSVGTAYVKVKYGTVEQTVAIDVKASAVLTTFDLEKTDVAAVEGGLASTLKLIYKDQYNKDSAPGAGVVAVEVADKTVANATVAQDQKSISVTGLKAGSTTVKVTYKDNTDASKPVVFEKSFNVNVSAKGTFASYKVEVDKTNLDVKDNVDTDADETTATVTVYGLDDKGQKISKIAADKVELVVLDADGKELVDDTAAKYITISEADDTVKAKAKGTETIAVKLTTGTLVLDKITFTVADSNAAATSVVWNYNAIADAAVGETIDERLADIVKVKDQFGKELPDADTKTTFKYVVTNNDGIKFNEDGKTIALNQNFESAATADVVVTEVTYDETAIKLASPQVIKLSVPAIKAEDKTADIKKAEPATVEDENGVVYDRYTGVDLSSEAVNAVYVVTPDGEIVTLVDPDNLSEDKDLSFNQERESGAYTFYVDNKSGSWVKFVINHEQKLAPKAE